MRVHNATRRPGGARGKKQGRRIFGAAACKFGIDLSTSLRESVAACRQEVLIGLHIGLPVMAHANVIVIDDVAHRGALRHHGQQLIHLFLVFSEHHNDVSGAHWDSKLIRWGVRKQRHYHPSQPLHRSHRGKQAGAVLA